MNILFVEDHLELIDELVAIIVNKHPDWNLQFATDISSAVSILQNQCFDGVVIDVMLASFVGIPQRSEGLYLARWILGAEPAISGNPAKSDIGRKPKIVFFTSRSLPNVKAEAKKLALRRQDYVAIARLNGDAIDHFHKLEEVFIVVGRLAGDALDHYTKIAGFIEK